MRYNIRLGYDAWRLLSAYSEPGDILSRIMERRGSNVDIINVDLAAHEADALASLAYDVMYRTSGATEGEKRTAQAIYEEIGHEAALNGVLAIRSTPSIARCRTVRPFRAFAHPWNTEVVTVLITSESGNLATWGIDAAFAQIQTSSVM